MFRTLSLKVYALKDLVNRLSLRERAGRRSCWVLLDALRVKNIFISASLLEAHPALAVYGRINQKCHGVALWINPSTCLRICPNKRKDHSG